MEKNGRQSAGPRSRHIDIRYFFIKDRIQRGEINLVYCPTGEMVADVFSKPLQGGLFKKFRDVVMGIRHPDALLDATPPGPGACWIKDPAREARDESLTEASHSCVKTYLFFSMDEDQSSLVESTCRNERRKGKPPEEKCLWRNLGFWSFYCLN